MPTAHASAYRARLRKVLEHIDAHLDEPLCVERLSGVAGFSQYHFHRQFAALYGLGVYAYVKALRLRRASYQLAFRAQQPIIDVAMASGYESHDAFARAFKKQLGQTPAAFRAHPLWHAWHAEDRRLRELRSLYMRPSEQKREVQIIDFPATRVGLLSHRGDPARIGETIRDFIRWRKESGCSPPESATFNLLYGAPEEAEAESFRLDLCATIARDVRPNPYGVIESTIPAGRCAVLRHVGSDDTLGASLHHLYANWLPASGEEPRDFPLFLRRVKFFPDVPEHEAVSELHLPLR